MTPDPNAKSNDVDSDVNTGNVDGHVVIVVKFLGENKLERAEKFAKMFKEIIEVYTGVPIVKVSEPIEHKTPVHSPTSSPTNTDDDTENSKAHSIEEDEAGAPLTEEQATSDSWIIIISVVVTISVAIAGILIYLFCCRKDRLIDRANDLYNDDMESKNNEFTKSLMTEAQSNLGSVSESMAVESRLSTDSHRETSVTQQQSNRNSVSRFAT
mmetsp:Transcript_7744/g.14409  ORF Transcript_7744/g.14409 Transcript_7744/m.14409 type:complete len:212 (-) Transcript_7744:25-660(-)